MNPLKKILGVDLMQLFDQNKKVSNSTSFFIRGGPSPCTHVEKREEGGRREKRRRKGKKMEEGTQEHKGRKR